MQVSFKINDVANFQNLEKQFVQLPTVFWNVELYANVSQLSDLIQVRSIVLKLPVIKKTE